MTWDGVKPNEGSLSRTSSSLLRGAQAADEAAWTRLVDAYSRLIYRWCRRSGLQAADAADVVQDVLRSVATNLKDFKHNPSEGSFRGWLRRITQRKLYDRYRQNKKLMGEATGGGDLNEWLASAVDDSDEESSVDVAVRRGHVLDWAAIQRVKSKVSERNWRIFWRVAVDGQPAAEAAAEFNVTVNVVRLTKSRILKRLREELASADNT